MQQSIIKMIHASPDKKFKREKDNKIINCEGREEDAKRSKKTALISIHMYLYLLHDMEKWKRIFIWLREDQMMTDLMIHIILNCTSRLHTHVRVHKMHTSTLKFSVICRFYSNVIIYLSWPLSHMSLLAKL